MEKEKRIFSRVDFNFETYLKIKERILQGEILNLSLDGTFVKMPEELKTGEEVELTLILNTESSSLSIKAGGKVVRSESSGAAIQFSKIDLESLTEIKNIIEQKLVDQYLKSIAIEK